MKKIKLTKEEDKDHKTLAKEYKRLEIFITVFMAIAICLGTFYFNVICFGPECENKSPTPIIIINPSRNTTNTDVERTGEDMAVNDKVYDKIVSGYWYNNGMIFFFSDGVFTIGRYGTDGGYNGKFGQFEKDSNANGFVTYKFDVAHEACMEDCMTPSNAYTLNITLECEEVSASEVVSIKSMSKTEEGQAEELSNYIGTYRFAGNNWDEVEKYVNNLNN